MTTYIIRRLLQSAFILVLLTVLFFLLIHFQPQTACQTIGCQDIQHLNQPIATQYLNYVGDLLHGKFGKTNTGIDVRSEIAQKLPPTIILVLVSLILQQLIALPLGILAAVRQYSIFDQAFSLLSYVFLSLPVIFLGALLLAFFPAHIGWFSVQHTEDATMPLVGSGDWLQLLRSDPALVTGDLLRHLTLPALTLVATGVAIDSRFMRASMLQVLDQDYIRTARAKGVRRRSIIFKHAFRNALLPIVTNIGLYLPALLGGAVVVEGVYLWDGVGYLYEQSAAGGGDFAVLETLLLFSSLGVLLANLLADIAYAWLDPRVRYESGTDD